MKISSIIIGLLILISTIQNKSEIIEINNKYETIIEDCNGIYYLKSEKYSSEMQLVFNVYQQNNGYDFNVYVKPLYSYDPSDEEIYDTSDWTLLEAYTYEDYTDYIKYRYPFEPDSSVKSLAYYFDSYKNYQVGVYVNSGKFLGITVLLFILISSLF